jgi:hemolysin III
VSTDLQARPLEAEDVRPSMRGIIHRVAAPLFAAAVVVLACRSMPAGHRVAIVVYGAGVTSMLSVSALYHTGKGSRRVQRVLKRIDHSTILLAIAGSYTAVTELTLHGRARVWMLIGMWLVAVTAAVIRSVWLDAPYPLVALVYVLAGWFMMVDLPAYLHGLSGGQFALILAGGIAYTIGGVLYAMQKPNPWPNTFGYHEFFHALVVVGAALHYGAVWQLVSRR